jgi:N-methylhydantoinase A
MAIDVARARTAMASGVGERLGVEALQAAWGVHEVINEDVARAFRVHASERGADYRNCSMIVFGGSGPLHGSRVARKLRIPRVICPWGAGVMSAFGLLASPIGFELARSRRVALGDLAANDLAAMLDALGGKAAEFLAEAGVASSDVRLHYRLDMRYEGQGYEVEVGLPDHLAPRDAAAALPALFAEAYRAVFGIAFPERPVEVVNWKVEAHGPVPGSGVRYRLRSGQRARDAMKGRRQAYFPEAGGLVECPVYDRYALAAGAALEGPALVEERESTCVLVPGDHAVLDESLNLVIHVGGTREPV